MNVTLVTPAAFDSLSGNRTTTDRWHRLLAELGHQVVVSQSWTAECETDVLVALHARKSFGSIERYRATDPEAPLVVALAGTDLYRDLDRTDEVVRALEMADAIVVLQPLATERVPEAARGKVRTILQSAEPHTEPAVHATSAFEVCVLSHLRPIKDPLLAAYATHHLEGSSRITVRHAGQALDPTLAESARRETCCNPRYSWLGPLPFAEARSLLRRSQLLILSSRDEGGANVVSEAIVAEVPILSTSIPGSIGLLGEGYPGYYPVGDHRALAALLSRAEREPDYLAQLRGSVAALRPQFLPEHERESWRLLLDDLRA